MKMSTSIGLTAAGAAALITLASCVVGNGEGLDPDPTLPCRAYPDDAGKCGQPWRGRIIQTCVEGGDTTTVLHYDRPDVPDSLQANVFETGYVNLYSLRGDGQAVDTSTVVCDLGNCRSFVTKLLLFRTFPGSSDGSGSLGFWEPEAWGSTANPADGGPLIISNVTTDCEFAGSN